MTKDFCSARSPLTLDKLCADVILVIFEKLGTLEDIMRLPRHIMDHRDATFMHLPEPILCVVGRVPHCLLPGLRA